MTCWVGVVVDGADIAVKYFDFRIRPYDSTFLFPLSMATSHALDLPQDIGAFPA